MDQIVKTRSIGKRFGKKTAVDNVTMTVNRGEIYGLLGPNGSGKTTTLRLILALMYPDAGEVELFGQVLNKRTRPPFERIGTMLEPGLYGNLTIKENLKLHAKLIGYPSQTRVDEVLEMVGLSDEGQMLCKKISLGMKQRVCIARAIYHKPELLILDEPMNAIDPQGTKKIREVFINIANHGTAIVMSTHLLTDIEQMATKIGIMNQGKLIDELGWEHLEQLKRKYLELKVQPMHKVLHILETHFHIRKYTVMDEDVVRIYEKIEESHQINQYLTQQGINVHEVKLSKDDLEEYFLKRVGGGMDA